MSGELASARDAWSRQRVVLILAAGYLATRLINFAALWVASGWQTPTGPPNDLGAPTTYYVHTASPASPGLGGVLANWDGQWYERIATDGYPSGADARSANDAWVWQFPPLFPLAARFLMLVTGLGFPVASVLLNLVLGGIATGLLYGIFRSAVSAPLALAGALSVNVFMTAPLFNVAYSEPAALVFLLLAIREILARRYAMALLAVLALAFTRPVAAPLALVFVVHWWSRLRSRNAMRPGWITHLTLTFCTVVSLVSPFLWSVTAALWLRDTQAITRNNGPISGSARAASMASSFDFGWFHRAHDEAGWLGTGLLIVAVAIGLGLPVAAARRLRLPTELQVWGVGYTLFVLLVTPVTPGFFRYLLLVAPLLAAVPMWTLTWARKGVGIAAFSMICAVGLSSQWFWIRYIYILDPAPALVPWSP
ncbi:hypothetical protein GCM10009817_37640 [Terrabacter lapilli]|uniref:Dolichyl-phosphate-mannose-protein mannosyltransferase n=1 Tax=Terrabacter lapilli TaxID=436231 RepID=A0ABP5E5C5_9MICO